MNLSLCKKKFPFVNSSCIGCGVCTAIAEDAFELDGDGFSHGKILDSYDETSVNDSISACPVSAISWKEEASENVK